MKTQKTWFITGTSQGFGMALVRYLLAKGDRVAATTRNLAILKDAVKAEAAQFLALQVDLSDEESIAGAVAAAIQQFGSIDYLVNNAGYGLIGGIEEASAKEVQASFDINVFGLLSVTRAVLPHMRKAGSGHIFNISSVFGLIAGAGWGIYCATKFAVEGLSEALAQEVKPFGIKVTIIEPGYFRTNFLNAGAVLVTAAPVADYVEIAEIKRKHVDEIPGQQIGNPDKAAEVIAAVAEMAEPPLHLLLGSDALQFAKHKISMLEKDFAATTALTLSTDYLK